MVRWFFIVLSASLVACAAAVPGGHWTADYDRWADTYRFTWLDEGDAWRDRRKAGW